MEYEQILHDKEMSKPARDFLKKRSIKPQTAKEWHIGFCPRDYIPKCYNKDDYPYYEKMQGRVILPVFDSNGKLITLSGRTIYDDLKPKYMHYTFPTRKTLFGLYINEKEIIKQNAIIFTEGQFDVISAWQRGLRNVVCTFGSHFSTDQIILSARYTNRVFILYDSDEAGQNGAYNSLQRIKMRGDVKIRLLTNVLKNGEDLDDYVKKNNFKFLNSLINATQEDVLKYKLQKMLT